MPVKRFIFCLIALCLMMLPLSAAAKDKNVGSVSGKLHKNSASGDSLSGAEVKCGGKSDKTDEHGKFKIKGIDANYRTTIWWIKADAPLDFKTNILREV
jgi:hypothetical protein